MPELDVQLLVGAAVTVFLALIFFGVVVLWDVALALRSVGDKIDKLEDNVDDDLMDIAHALDSISSAPSNGGTQLHLSGGTISSGPTTGQEQGQPVQGPQTQATQPQGTDPQAAGGMARGTHQHHQSGQQPSPAGGSAGVDDEAETAASEGGESGDGLEQTADGDGTAGDDAVVESTSDADESESTADGATDEAAEPHPRAKHNRGRFVTSPDRTAWYATPLDREAIRTAEPTIAGALTDGSDTGVDETEIIAAGPVESVEAAESTEPTRSVESDATDDASDADVTDDVSASDSSGTKSSSAPDGTAADESESDADESDGADDSPSTDTDALAFDEAETDVGAGSTASESDSAGESDGADETADTDAERGDEPGEGATAGTELEPVDETDVDVHDAETEVDRHDAESEVDVHETESVEETALEREADTEAETDAQSETETAADEVAQPFDGDVGAFEFDEDIEDDVTVEEAVDTINEDAPAPELSSHQFDVTAEVYGSEEGDDDGAVLVFEFDTETVDISGSTKRLLQYQMRSFADRDSTPDGDVTIGRSRIVIEIPDSDGNAVKRWGDAAVSIIDRTLYLSDNSSDDS